MDHPARYRLCIQPPHAPSAGPALLLALALLGGLAAPATMAEPPAAAAYEYHYFKQSIPISLDASRLALKTDGAPLPADADLDAKGAAPSPVRGWQIVPTAAAARADAGRRVPETVDRLAAAPVAFVSPVFLAADGAELIVTPDLLVGFDPAVPAEAAEKILAAAGAGTITDRDWTGMTGVYRVRSSSRSGLDVLAVANTLALNPAVRFAEPDMIFTGRSDLIPNDPLFNQCWGLHNTGQSGGVADMDMDVPEAWDITTGSNSIIVVVIDNGVQLNHPDLNLGPAIDTTSDAGSGGPVNACDMHGTPVAGCISGTINNGLGSVGVAPGCRSASARTFISNQPCNGGWTSQASWTVNTLAWAQSIGARVTNNSNGYGFTSAAIAQKYADTRAAGIVHFASAGNDSSPTITYPSSLPDVNAVAALHRTGTLASFSNWGVGIDFSAPGQAIVAADRTGSAGYAAGDYATVDGTSFASPYTAGVAALVLSQTPGLSAAQVEARLQQTCVNLGPAGYDTTFGWGFVNAAAALTPGAPANNACASAAAIGNGVTSFNTTGATTDGPTDALCQNASSNQVSQDIWYRYTMGACSGTVTVSLCGSGFDTKVAVYGATCPGAPNTAIACNDDSATCGASSLQSHLTFSGVAGQQYLIRVGGYLAAAGAGTITITPPSGPPNNACASAIPLPGNGAFTADSCGASTDGPNDGAACLFAGSSQTFNDVWYRYTAPCSTSVRVMTCGAGIDTRVSIYGASCPSAAGQALACNDDACGLRTQVNFSATAGQQYLIRIGSFSAAVTGTIPFTVRYAADWDGDGDFTPADVATYINAWFTSLSNGNHDADFNNDNVVDPSDVAGFVSAWVAALNNGC